MHNKTNISSGMRNKNGCKVCVVMVSLLNWDVRLFRRKGDAAAAANVHRNTISAIKDRGVVGDWLVIIVEEE